MSIQVFNTLTGKKEEFVPVEPGKVSLYACGPTVYDSSHLGHARKEIVWDVIQRYLRFAGYKVTFVRNITDIDDKIINRSKELNIRPDQLARHYLYEFWQDMDALNVAPPDIEPRATEYLQQMIGMAEDLVKKGKAYEAEGDVYFDVGACKDYGKLGKKNIDDLKSGAREQVRSQSELKEVKRNPVDFALWKSAPQGETGWMSPWGFGRPGWHLECSSMIKSVLGETIDIHGGGEDLVFPHHENEKAQSESLHDKPLAKYWLHNSFINVSEEKMSKSLGNFKTIGALLKEYSADTLRLFILQTHYRNPIEFSPEAMNGAKQALMRLLRASLFAETEENGGGFAPSKHYRFDQKAAEAYKNDKTLSEFHTEFVAAMDNDFNTAVAISNLFGLADKISASRDANERKLWAKALKDYAGVLGFTLTDTRKDVDRNSTEQVLALLLQLRQDARANKDFKTSDLIRNELAKAGISVMDTAEGPTWEKT